MAPGGYDYMDYERFLQEYSLKIDFEFAHDDQAAEWAENGHRFWAQEDAALEFEEDDPAVDERGDASSGALSTDHRFLAISTNAVIRIYDVQSKQILSVLKGHDQSVSRMYFAPQQDGDIDDEGSAKRYTLVSSGEHGVIKGQIIVWYLDVSGLPTGQSDIGSASPDVDSLADQAMTSVAPGLTHQHGMETEELGSLRDDMAETLRVAVFKHNTRKLPMLDAHLPAFGFDSPISSDGKRAVTLEKNQSTQGGMRPLTDMPRIVVRNLSNLSEEWRLTGHQDGIMWAGFSPDGTRVAEASWDQTYGIWDTGHNDRAEGHLIGPSGGQNWVGDFSADGKYIVFSGGRPTKVAVYEVETGNEVAQLNFNGIRDWVRRLKWSPIDYTIAVVVNHEVVLWHPLDGNTFTSVLKMYSDGTLLTDYNRLNLVQWVDEGQKLLVRDTANNIYVWDIRMNKKWRFQRPDGMTCEYSPGEVFFSKRLAKEGALLGFDGDGKVRYWYL